MINFNKIYNKKSSAEQEDLLGEIPRLLLTGKKTKKSENFTILCQLLSNYYFIEAKINHPLFGVQALIEDYDLLDTSEIKNNLKYAETVKALKLIQRALFSSTHILFKDPKQLKGQLSARLTYFDLPEIKNLLAQIATDKNTGLYSLIGSLTPPGGELITTPPGYSSWVNAIAVTSDGKTVISGSGKNIKISDIVTGTEKFTLQGHSNWVRSITLILDAHDGQTLISGSDDRTIKIWNLATGQEKVTLQGHTSWVTAIALTPDSDSKTIISGSGDRTIKIWDLATGQKKFTLQGYGSWVNGIAVTPNGKTVISCSNEETIKIWDLGTGTEKFTLQGHSDWVYAIAVTPDGKTVISGSNDKTIKIWDLGTGTEKFTLKGHRYSVNAIAVTPDGKTVISGSNDNTIKIWDLATRKEIATFTGESPINCCAVAPDGVTIVAGEQSGRLHFLRLQGKVTDE